MTSNPCLPLYTVHPLVEPNLPLGRLPFQAIDCLPPWIFLAGLFSLPLKEGTPPKCSDTWRTNSLSANCCPLQMSLVVADGATEGFGVTAVHGHVSGGHQDRWEAGAKYRGLGGFVVRARASSDGTILPCHVSTNLLCTAWIGGEGKVGKRPVAVV